MMSLAELLCVIDDFCLEFEPTFFVGNLMAGTAAYCLSNQSQVPGLEKLGLIKKHVDAGNKKPHPVKPKSKNSVTFTLTPKYNPIY